MDQALAQMPSHVRLLKPRAVGMGESLIEEDLMGSPGIERVVEQVRFKRFDDG